MTVIPNAKADGELSGVENGTSLKMIGNKPS